MSFEHSALIPRAAARLAEYAPGRTIALPPHTTFALLEQPVVFEVPGAARHACGLLSWRDMRLPLLDLNRLLHGEVDEEYIRVPRFAQVVAWQPAPYWPLQYGALGLSSMPQTIVVEDESQCALPEDNARWTLFALSCFQHEGQVIPVLDTARLFGAAGARKIL
jgi:hypothetical protein